MKEITVVKAIKLMVDGEEVINIEDGDECKFKFDKSEDCFKCRSTKEGSSGVWLCCNDFEGTWHEQHPQKTRPMTRDEVLGFMVHTSGIVVKADVADDWLLPHGFAFSLKIECYFYATIDKYGNIGEPQKFVKVIE